MSHATNMKAYWKRHTEKRMAWATANPERVAQIRRKHFGQPEPTRPRPKYCELCGVDPALTAGRWKTLHLEHNHATGEFRGWVCQLCNLGLGHFRDNPVLLRTAAKYLEANGDWI